ncbi:PP2C family protein-serine/threonine phosphatase [Streptomyces sp. WMMC500]|uniref:PP2C family protein-serine/threonine phosphatase n=1 Tax=Streptomyces sp. WMMC500 TaxID=3015154 RepID=UPI00248B49E0|nr:PP2C family protein-serine/threonine phosphatase [Streptomyces sp. WMMC500]WBB61795.1 PP2C family protein-serine/threonine phosphatase [Streptomyces sp. WMMC500]
MGVEAGVRGAVVVVLLVAGAVANLLGPEPFVGLPLLAAVPLVAGAVLSLRLTAVFAVLTLLVAAALDLQNGRSAVPWAVDMTMVTVTGSLGVLINRLLTRERRSVAQARDVAEAVQRAVLPDPPARAGALMVAARYETAHTEARIGGDLYAVQDGPWGTRVLIGDVRGKGLQAVASVSVAIGAFRQEAEKAPTLADLAWRLDEALRRENERRGPAAAEDFMTAVLAEVSPDGASVRTVNCGHPSPYLVHDGAVVRLDPTRHELPLGVGLRTPPEPGDESLATDTFTLPEEAALLLVTDGVTEARDPRGTFYDARSAGCLTARPFPRPDLLLDALLDDVAAWTGGENQDDMAVVALSRVRRTGRTG